MSPATAGEVQPELLWQAATIEASSNQRSRVWQARRAHRGSELLFVVTLQMIERHLALTPELVYARR